MADCNPKIEEFSVKRQFWLFGKEKVFCEKANFGQNSAKLCLCSQNLPFYRIIGIGLKTVIFDPLSYKVTMEKTRSNFLQLKLCFWISSSVPLQWLSSKKLMECLKGQRFQFLGMFQWFCEKANFGYKGKFWLNFGQNLPFHRTLSKKPKFAFSLKAPQG